MSENEHTKKQRNHGVPGQVLLDAGLNVFALQLLVESYTDHPNPIPVSFPFKGVNITLSLCEHEIEQADEREKADLPACDHSSCSSTTDDECRKCNEL